MRCVCFTGLVHDMRFTIATLVFDGECGFCTRCVLWLQRLDRRARVETLPHQALGVRDRFGLSEGDVDRSVWVIRDGRRHAGAAAVALALDTALGTRMFHRFATAPIVGPALERAYQFVAEHRGRLAGVTPWCRR